MTLTTHGHHIPETSFDDEDSLSKIGHARCGGPGICEQCNSESSIWWAGNPPKLFIGELENSKASWEKNFLNEHVVKPEMVDHPAHYNSDPSGIECIQIVRYQSFNTGSATKYAFRAGLKVLTGDALAEEIQDLEKAVWYLNDEIANFGKMKWTYSAEYLTALQAVIKHREGLIQGYFISIYGEDIVTARDFLIDKVIELKG